MSGEIPRPFCTKVKNIWKARPVYAVEVLLGKWRECAIDCRKD